MGTGGGGVPRVFGCEEKLAHVNQKHKGAQIPGWIGAGCIVQSVAEPARIMVVITHIHSSTPPWLLIRTENPPQGSLGTYEERGKDQVHPGRCNLEVYVWWN